MSDPISSNSSIAEREPEPLPSNPEEGESPGSNTRFPLGGMTVEPILFVHNIASSLLWVTSQDLMVDKACRVNCEYSTSTCDDLTHHKPQQEAVNHIVSDVIMWKSILETSIKVVWVLYLGSISDMYGRKIPLLISLAGLFGEVLTYLVLFYSPALPVETVLISSVPYAFSGGTHALLMICFSLIADTSSTKKRTLRVGILDGFYYLGSPVGMALQNPLRKWGGQSAVFIFVTVAYIISIAYILIVIKENTGRQSTEEASCVDRGCYDLTIAIRKTIQPRQEEGATFCILILILAMMFDSLPVWGSGNVKYLFTQEALDWDHTEYSNWGTVTSILNVIGALLILPLMAAVLELTDLMIGIIGALSRCGSNILYGLVTTASQGWIMYTGSVIATGSPLCPISIRAMLSKLSGPDVGKVYAVMAMCECFLPFIAAPIYNKIFSASPFMPGSYNFFSAGMNALIVVCFGIVYSKYPRDVNNQQRVI